MQVLDSRSAKGPYSSVIRAGDFIYLAGQGSIDLDSGAVVLGSIEEETRRTIHNMETLLARAGATLHDLVQITCYLTDIAEWPRMNGTYADLMAHGVRPVRTAIGVDALPLGLRVEMTGVAYLPLAPSTTEDPSAVA